MQQLRHLCSSYATRMAGHIWGRQAYYSKFMKSRGGRANSSNYRYCYGDQGSYHCLGSCCLSALGGTNQDSPYITATGGTEGFQPQLSLHYANKRQKYKEKTKHNKIYSPALHIKRTRKPISIVCHMFALVLGLGLDFIQVAREAFFSLSGPTILYSTVLVCKIVNYCEVL